MSVGFELYHSIIRDLWVLVLFGVGLEVSLSGVGLFAGGEHRAGGGC